jgi:hypothetical protein
MHHIDQDIKFLARKTQIKNERAHNSVAGTLITVLGVFALLIVGAAVFLLSPASGGVGEMFREFISGFIPPELKP